MVSRNANVHMIVLLRKHKKTLLSFNVFKISFISFSSKGHKKGLGFFYFKPLTDANLMLELLNCCLELPERVIRHVKGNERFDPRLVRP